MRAMYIACDIAPSGLGWVTRHRLRWADRLTLGGVESKAAGT